MIPTLMAIATTGDDERRITDGLVILAADEEHAALGRICAQLRSLGHEVIGRAVSLGAVADEVAGEQPDLAIVAVRAGDDHALALISEITEVAGRPVIALLGEVDPGFIREAAERGIFAYAQSDDPAHLQGAIEVAVQRFREARALGEQVDRLETALERRALIERAKGILMERHGIDDARAFGLLRDQARRRSRSVVDLARGVLDGHPLLPKRGT
jgi:AmiR/NasT family two-component response regulator